MGLNSCCGEVQSPGIIYQSGDTPFTIQLLKESCPGQPEPFDLTNATEIWALFPTLVSPPVILKLSLSQLTVVNPPGAGTFSGTMSRANALLLTTGLINVEVRVTIAGVITTFQILGQLTVDPSLFPGF